MDPLAAVKVTGSTFIRGLYEDVLITIDGRGLTKPALAEMGVVNFSAARRLGHYLRRHKVTTTTRLAAFSPYDLLRERLHGPALVWTTMLLLDAGHVDPLEWWGAHPTLHTVKKWSRRRYDEKTNAAE